MPYTYTLAWEARNTGMPLMRSLWLHYPDDATAKATGSEYLWGRDLLIAPVFKKGATSWDIYLPKGDWYDWWTNEKKNGGQTITRPVDLSVMPIYAKAGAVIPFDPIRQYTSEVVEGPTTLKIFTGANGSFTLYDDDGISQEYLKGVGTFTDMIWDDKSKRLTIKPGGKAANVSPRTFRVELIPAGTVREIVYSGKQVAVGF
jgi:alpha-glucosidase/alpha-D-xyloside xylohydrolase